MRTSASNSMSGWPFDVARKAKVVAKRPDGTTHEFSVIVRVDTPQEREYYRHGGILQYVLRQLAVAGGGA